MRARDLPATQQYKDHGKTLRERVVKLNTELAKEQEKLRPKYSRQELFLAWEARGDVPVADEFLAMLRKSSEVGDSHNENLIQRELERSPHLKIFTDHHYALQTLCPFLLWNLADPPPAHIEENIRQHSLTAIRPLTWDCASGMVTARNDDRNEPHAYINPTRKRFESTVTKHGLAWASRNRGEEII